MAGVWICAPDFSADKTASSPELRGSLQPLRAEIFPDVGIGD